MNRISVLSSALLSTLVSAALYLAIALWSVRAVLPAPGSTFPQLGEEVSADWEVLLSGDQRLTAWGVSRNARTLLTAPWRLFEGEQCYPLPHSMTLGEHMFGEGLLGTIPYLLTGNPILTYNATAILILWGGAMSMYTLVFYWTRNAGAALVAGLLFGFHPSRVGDLVHLHVIDNCWIPLCLLFADRLFSTQRWRDAFALTTLICLQALASFYMVLTLLILGTIYGVYLVGRNLHLLVRLAPKLGFTIAAVALFCVGLFSPYLETQDAWAVLHRPNAWLMPLTHYGRGGIAYLGSVLLLLSAVALLDRFRGPRRWRNYDPRLIFLVAGLFSVWASVGTIPIPLSDTRIPSLYVLASELIPGLHAVRAGQVVRAGALIVGAFLAGLGFSILNGRGGYLRRALLLLLFTTAGLAEVFFPPLARRSFGRSLAMRPYLVRPMPGLVELYSKGPPGPVLDLPFTFGAAGFLLWMPHYTFLNAFHKRPVAACYNSFITPVQREIESIAARLPDSKAADALYALGFRTIMLHHELLQRRADLVRLVYLPSSKTHLVKMGRSLLHTAFRIEGHGAVTEELSALEQGPAPEGKAAEATPPETEIAFRFHNRSSTIYRHPLPPTPTRVTVTWKNRVGVVTRRDEISTLLPLALAPGEATESTLLVPVPLFPGVYTVTLVPAEDAGLVLAKQVVRVVKPAPRKGISR